MQTAAGAPGASANGRWTRHHLRKHLLQLAKRVGIDSDNHPQTSRLRAGVTASLMILLPPSQQAWSSSICWIRVVLAQMEVPR